ncbi:hypothetical protein FG079_18120 [Vibrio cholerae]|nr:hypothetical protein [Vibrio cholerae]
MSDVNKYFQICEVLEDEFPYQKAALELFPKLFATCQDVEVAKDLTLEIIAWSCSVPDLSHVTVTPKE